MVTVDFKLSLPEQLLKEAEDAGLLSSSSIERLIREEIRRRRVEAFFSTIDGLAALNLPLLSDEEIAREIHLTRKPSAA